LNHGTVSQSAIRIRIRIRDPMPRFVVLEHAPGLKSRRGCHWDLMLEAGGSLRTWALAEPPAAGRSIDAEKLADHRLEYLDYEGPLSGERGNVTRWDGGTYEVVEETENTFVVAFKGTRWKGRAVLVRDPTDMERWRLECGTS
jgi:hypothetical protein